MQAPWRACQNVRMACVRGIEMEQITDYIKPELLSVAVALYFIGMGLKKAAAVPDKFIPLILGVTGILLSGLYVIGTCPLSTFRGVAMAVFTAIVQGLLVAGLSTYVNQIIKQASKKE